MTNSLRPHESQHARLPVLPHLPEFAQTRVHWVTDTIQPSHPVPPPSSLTFGLFQHQGLFQWVYSSYQVAKVLELAFLHSLLEKCKSKPQWGITSRQSEWLSSKSLQTTNAGKGVEKRECSCTVGRNVNWYSHYGRWYGDSFKNSE